MKADVEWIHRNLKELTLGWWLLFPTPFDLSTICSAMIDMTQCSFAFYKTCIKGSFLSFKGQLLKVKPTLSMRDSSMLLEYSFSLNSSRSIRELSMSADRWGMLETQATVRSLAGVGGLRVDGVWEPWEERPAHWIWEHEFLNGCQILGFITSDLSSDILSVSRTLTMISFRSSTHIQTKTRYSDWHLIHNAGVSKGAARKNCRVKQSKENQTSSDVTCLLMVGLSRCCCGWDCCCGDCWVLWLVVPCGLWLSLTELCWWGRPGAVLSLTDSCRPPCCLPPYPDSGDWRRFPLCGRVLAGAAGVAAALTDSWWEVWDLTRWVGGGATELWRMGWTVEGGVAAREEWEVPVWEVMPIICCWCWRLSFRGKQVNNKLAFSFLSLVIFGVDGATLHFVGIKTENEAAMIGQWNTIQEVWEIDRWVGCLYSFMSSPSFSVSYMGCNEPSLLSFAYGMSENGEKCWLP